MVLDLCCGAGAVGAALAAGSPDIELYAADIDPAAVRSARRNIRPPGQVFEGDLFDAIPRRLRGRFDVITANAPYVPTDAIALMPPEARLYEASVALDGGEDGLDLHRRITASVAEWLVPGGHLLIETSLQQAEQTLALLRDGGLEARVERSEELEGTVVVGQRTISRPSSADR
jgi:release factor glutamine methyltransferase